MHEPLEPRRLLAASVPAGFQYETLLTGLGDVTSVTFAPDGRLFYAEKTGAVRVVKDGAVLPTPLVRVAVDEYVERGLECVTLDPDFATNGVFYLYYTRRDPANPDVPGNNAKNRVSRFRVDPANPDRVDAGTPEAVVLDDIPSDTGYHNGGAMVFGTDGMMYVGTGDAGPVRRQDATTNSQDLSRLYGKVLRINPRAGAQVVPADNPYVGQAGVRPEIYAYGVRNPFTMAVQPGTGVIYLNDVGSGNEEEVNEVAAAKNYGWPMAEGPSSNPALTNPVYAYRHDGANAAVTGGAFAAGDAFPDEYDGKYFVSDYIRRFIRVFDPATRTATPFASDIEGVIDVDFGTDGALYGPTRLGTIVRISYVGEGNRNPTAVAEADRTSGGVPLAVRFSAEGSSDPDGDALTYAWAFGDGATASGVAVTHTYAEAGTYAARLTVGDGNGGSDVSEAITVVAGEEAPVPVISAPAAESPYAAGQTVTFAGTASDPEDGALAPGTFDWTVVLHHGNHTHPFLDAIDGVAAGSFTLPVDAEVDPDQFYRVHLRVTDSAGVEGATFVDIKPRTATFTVQTNVPGLGVTLDGMPQAGPLNVTGVVGTPRAIGAPESQELGGVSYRFAGWSDGGAATHAIITPEAATTYTALYEPQGFAVAEVAPEPRLRSLRVAGGGPDARGAVQVRLANVGGADLVSGPATVVVFASADATAGGAGDVEVGRVTRNVKLRRGQTGKPLNVKVTLPALAAGEYFLVARATVDGTGGGVAERSSASPVVVEEPVVRFPTVADPGRAFPLGRPARVPLPLTNAGNVDTGRTTATLRLTLSPAGQPGVVAFTQAIPGQRLSVRRGATVSLRLRADFAAAAVPPGSYVLTVELLAGEPLASLLDTAQPVLMTMPVTLA